MKILFNDNWQFAKYPLETSMETIFNDSNFSAVDLPHDWMIYDVKNLYEEAISCYKKTFQVKKDTSQRITLRFEGVYMDTTIYLNKKEVMIWKNGYSTFDLDLTDIALDGENEIIIRNVYQLPNSRWYPGSGIYRNVFFITQPTTYFPLDGSYVSTQKNEKDWTVHVDIEAIAPSPQDSVIRHTILDSTGAVIQSVEIDTTLDNNLTVVTAALSVTQPRLWDITDPYLYRLRSELLVNHEVLDSIEQNLGFRSYYFDHDKGFFLNDRYVKIHGSCEHHVLGSLGAAMNRDALKRQFEVLIDMGVNSVRSAHNMPAVEFMDLADEMGLLVYSESFDMWERTKTDYDYGNDFAQWWEKDLTSWVRRDRNHPSLFVWGIGNEIYDTHFERGLELTKILRDAVYKLDPRKNGLTGLGSNFIAYENAQKCAAEVDLAGYNYHEHLYNEHHEKYPDWNIFGSETSSTVQSRGIYHFPASNRLLTYDDGQCSCLGNCTTNWGAKNSMKAITDDRDHEFCWGQYIWSGWDYLGEPTPYFTKNSYFGQIDTAGFKKDTYYVYQSEWTDYKTAPMIHLYPYWDFNDGQLIDIAVNSNAPKVELFFQDKSYGSFDLDHKKGLELTSRWQIPYEKGTLRAVAYDENGTIIAEDIQTSFSDPATIVAEPDKTSFVANGSDLIFLSLSTQDEAGTFVANGRSRLNVTVSGAGRLIGLDNGDSTDYDQYKGTSRRLFSGRLLAIIAAKDQPGEVNVTITSADLPTKTLSFTALPGQVPIGTSCQQENTVSPENNEIPVRKIELTNLGTNHLNDQITSTTVTAELLPANTTYSDITFKALTLNGVESNCVKIVQDGHSATVTALGDGEFRLCCSCNNGGDHSEVLSELEFDITNMGTATFDPYELVSAIDYAESNFELPLSFQGGVYVTTNERTYLAFENVDFGDYGSDEISLPIFSFADVLPVEVWDGIPEKGGELLLEATYQAKSWYNHYQANSFKLSKRLRGTRTISIVVIPDIKMSLQGFSFTYYEKAFSKIPAIENTRITGDAFTFTDTAVERIGNNVTMEFENMDFSDKGTTSITLGACSHAETNTIHIKFIHENEEQTTQIIEIPFSESEETYTFPLERVTGKCKVNFIFLPGSNCDISYIHFSN